MMLTLFSPDFEVFYQKRQKKKIYRAKCHYFLRIFEVLFKKSPQGEMPLFSTDFEVISKNKKIKKRVFTMQRADFTRKRLIIVFDLFQISLIIFICTVFRPTNEDLLVCKKLCLS